MSTSEGNPAINTEPAADAARRLHLSSTRFVANCTLSSLIPLYCNDKGSKQSGAQSAWAYFDLILTLKLSHVGVQMPPEILQAD